MLVYAGIFSIWSDIMIRLLSIALVALLLPLTGGCAFVGYAAAIIPGPGTKAHYPGLAGQRVAVLAWAERAVTYDFDSLPADVSMGVANKLIVAAHPSIDTAELKGTSFVDPRQVFRWQKNHPELANRSIIEVAPKLAADLGATRVIYVEVSPFSIYDPRTPILLKGYANMTIRVAEVNGQNVKMGYEESEVTVDYPEKAPEGLPPTDEIKPSYIYKGLVDAMTTEVAKRFFANPAE
jgi:hypothetical protein